MRHQLIEIDWPEFGQGDSLPCLSADELMDRINKTRDRMQELHLSHLVVYGDSEHFSNIQYLTGFDPRFEEALLIIPLHRSALLLVGTECKGYLPISPLFREGKIRTECFQSFSLVSMPRGDSRPVDEIFADEGIGEGSVVGCAGWKYFTEIEFSDANHTLEIPSFIVDSLRRLAGVENVLNCTDIFINPDNGLRTSCSTTEIAYLEYSNTLASEGLKRILFGIREGMTDYEAAALCQYNGLPLGCRMTLKTGKNRISLASPAGEIVKRGNPLSTNLCYWGSNICRSGWVAETSDDLPEEAREYVNSFAGPYFEAMGAWLESLKIGAMCGDITDAILRTLSRDRFHIELSPGHLIHMDEWVSSPFYLGSRIPLRSGMAIQSDVIPHSKVYSSTRMEEGYVLADKNLRAQLSEQFPECMKRCLKRREFMRKTIGIDIHDDVLPLSNMAGIVPPFLLNIRGVFTMQH